MYYKLEEALNKNGTNKQIEQKWFDYVYIISKAKVGSRAFLSCVGTNGEYLLTTAVEKIVIIDNNISITTADVVYKLKSLNKEML